MNFTVKETELLVEALQMAASRHESYSRFTPRSAKPHDDKAAGMRALRQRLKDASTSTSARSSNARG